jgi:2-oxoglutarate ferredoxin oxidoreductase subunit gamma
VTGERFEIRIAGAGGQGVVHAGLMLAEAAVLSGLSATHSQVYGPESRGGTSRSDVVIADGEIGFPLADTVDVMLVLNPESWAKRRREAGSGIRMLVDSIAVGGEEHPGVEIHPIVETARLVSGGQLVAGVVGLGVLNAHTGVVDAEALREAVAARVPSRHRAMNLEALAAGGALVTGVTTGAA